MSRYAGRGANNFSLSQTRIGGPEWNLSKPPSVGWVWGISVAIAVGGCGAAKSSQSVQANSRSSHATPQSSAPPGLISITAPSNCSAAASGGITGYFTLTVADNGNDYAMRPCQVVFVQLLHAQPDGCHWTTVELFEALGSGRATLESTLVCPDGHISSRWSMAAEVGR